MLRRTSGSSGGGAGSVGHPDYYYVPHLGSIQSQITLAENAGHNAGWPAWVVVQENRTENITLKPGIYVTGGVTSGTRSPIVIDGTVTISPVTGTFQTNKYSIEKLSFAPTAANSVVLTVSGTNESEIFLSDLTLTTSGTSGAGRCLSVTNSHADTVVKHQGDLILNHSGTGWCIECTKAKTSLDRVFSPGPVGTARIANLGTELKICRGECTGGVSNATATFSCEANAKLTIGAVYLKHNNPNQHAIWVGNGSGGNYSLLYLMGTVFDVTTASGSGLAIAGDSTGNMFHSAGWIEWTDRSSHGVYNYPNYGNILAV